MRVNRDRYSATCLRALCLGALAISLTGCDVDVDSAREPTPVPAAPLPADPAPAVPSTPAPDRGPAVDIDIDDRTPAADSRVERRQERRENIREAIDNVDVKVGDGGVDVDVQ